MSKSREQLRNELAEEIRGLMKKYSDILDDLPFAYTSLEEAFFECKRLDEDEEVIAL